MSADWTIAELIEQAAAALARHEAPESGRVRAVPDERAVRYYTTLGLLDRPSLRGRTAYYGARHLAQLVAIKREQARGLSLAAIQASLPALDDQALTDLSGVAVAPAPRAAARPDFWRARPAPPAPPPATSAPPSTVRVELDLGGARLSFAPERALTSADLEALRVAAAPLLAELARRHLVTPEPTP